MDDRRFDDLSRRLASNPSRRQVLRGLVGAAIAGLFGLRVDRQSARARPAFTKPLFDMLDGEQTNTDCTSDEQCNDGQVCKADACTPGCRIAGVFVLPGASPFGNPCLVCRPGISRTNWTNNDGVVCNDGNACTVTDTCQGGVCVGGSPVVCTVLDACHDVGVCDTATGKCTNPPKKDGTRCSDSNTCTAIDTCQGGICTGANPVDCAPPDQCHDAGVCDDATGECVYQAKADGTPCQGADLCLQSYACQASVCVGAQPVICVASDLCHEAGTCNPATGACSNPPAAGGTSCGAPICEGPDLQTFACDGQGACVQSTTDCLPFLCDPVTTACAILCASDEKCAPGLHCVDEVCCPGEDFCEWGGVCCDSERSPTATCCPANDGGCCECFENNDPGGQGIICCDPVKVCGPVGADTCCHNDENCVAGDCCHVTFHCEGSCCDRPCCNGVCCPNGQECVNGACVSEGRTCEWDAVVNPNCLEGEVCSFDGECCTTDRVFEVNADIDGVPTVIKICCPYGDGICVQGAGCCRAPDFGGTSRGSRIRT